MLLSECEPSSSNPGWSYDVFLSFRGEDTRKNFTDHLYTALIDAGIRAFRDDDELPRGEEISSQLIEAIRGSRISVVVFSKGYASSRWCLDELVEIIECKHTIGQIVLPIFYDINPSDVRKQTGSFAAAFVGHEERFKKERKKVNEWRRALVEAGNLSGWDLQNEANGYESKCIQKIVKDILSILDRKYLNVPDELVGMDSRVDDIITRLGTETNDVRIMGIHGMAGIGKTTVAKVVFNRLFHGFKGSCFLSNIKESSKESNGPVKLQQLLLGDILRPNLGFHCVHRGMKLIEESLSQKRVLIVLDDVDELHQLNALVGERRWFGSGSRIIIITQDERLLTQFEVDVKYEAGGLNHDESVELFSLYAFKNTRPDEEYVELSNKVVDNAGGHPLALEVFGSCFFYLSKRERKIVVEKLQKEAEEDIYKKLKISFETLGPSVQNMFLDIACFFIGRNKEYVAKVLDPRYGFEAEKNFTILIERSFLTIDDWNELRMHDLLRDMGRKIIQKSPDVLGERSRIWFHEDAWKVLNNQTGTKNVQGLVLDVRGSKVASLTTKSFSKMINSQLLQINGVDLDGDYTLLPKQLIWLCWHECPLKYLPSNFHLDDLAVLDMQYSSFKEIWKEIMSLENLKILNLSYSKDLITTPNFSEIPSLEKLILEGCSCLVEVHESVGKLEKLVSLNLERCWSVGFKTE